MSASTTDGEPVSVLSRDEEHQLFQRLVTCRQHQLGLALQSPGGLAELGRVCREPPAHLAEEPLEARRLSSCWRNVRRLQRRALPLWQRLQAAQGTGAECEAVLAELQDNRDQTRELLGAVTISSELRQRLTASALASLRDADDASDVPARTCVLAAWMRDVEGEISKIESHIVAANQGLVCVVLKRYLGLGLTLPDLMQEGNLGLMRALEKFDPERGVRFNTYAGWWIRQSARRAISNQSRTIRVPVHALDAKYVVGRAQSRLTAKLGRTPSNDELARDTGYRRELVNRVETLVQEPVSLEAPRSAENETRLLDLLPDTETAEPDEGTSAEERRSCIDELMSELTPREQMVMRLRFGFEAGQEECTLEQLGQRLGVTRERARQILQKSLSKLRRAAARLNIDVSLLN